MEIKKILFPTDFSEVSLYALQFANDIARRYGSKLYLLHVIYDVVKVGGWFVPHASLDEMYKDTEKGAKKEMDRYGLEELRGYKDVERSVVRGVPYEEIIKFANKEKADLIIMGTHSREGMGKILFGSTAAHVVRNAPCPVLAVRLPKYKE